MRAGLWSRGVIDSRISTRTDGGDGDDLDLAFPEVVVPNNIPFAIYWESVFMGVGTSEKVGAA